MSLKITRNVLYSCFAIISLLMVLLFVPQNNVLGYLENQVCFIATICIASYIIILICIYSCMKSIGIYFIFVVISFFFFFGQHVLVLLNLEPQVTTFILLSKRISDEAIYETGLLIIRSMCLLTLGYILAIGNSSRKLEVKPTSIYTKEALRKSCIIFFLICVIPTCITLARNIILTFTIGYGTRIIDSQYQLSGISNIFGILASFMPPILIGLFVAKRANDKWIIPTIVIYLCLYTCQGSRINSFVLIVVFLYLQIKCYNKIKRKTYIKIAMIAIVVIVIFSVVSNVRGQLSTGQSVSSAIASSIKNTMENNALISAISEAGYTFSSTAVVIQHCPNDIAHTYGLSYLSALAYILPNDLTGNFYATVQSTDDAFKGFLNQYGGGIGSSFIAEGYYNFGYLAYLLFFVFGIAMATVEKKFTQSIANGDSRQTFKYMYIFSIIIFYIRSDTRTFFRNYVWFCIPILLITNYLMQKMDKRCNNSKFIKQKTRL
ncbi:MAG: O-antigen polysaccharide polymerase Wzy [Christensenellaceae bacterium]